MMTPILATMLSVSGFELTNEEKHLLEKANPLGITLFKRNVKNKKQVKALIKSIKEVIEFYYNHSKYIYKIDNYYMVDKTGKVNIIRDKNKDAITLITCSQTDKTKQLVYIGYLIDKIVY